MNQNLSMEGIASQLSHTVLKKEAKRMRKRRQAILYLILNFLNKHNYQDTYNALMEEADLSTDIQICDNIDLEMILTEYDSYYQLRFNTYPMLCKEVKSTTECTKKKECANNMNKRMEPVKKKSAEQTTNDDSAEDVTLAMTVTPVFPSENEHRSASKTDDCSKEQSIQSKISRCIEKLYPADSELRKIAEDISREIVSTNLNVHWNDVKGLGVCKTAIEEAVVYPLKYPTFFNAVFSPWKGILLYGPPGTGKTMLAKATATECNSTFFNITASSLVSKWRGDSEKYIRVLFDLAYSHSPTIIFIDEIDWIATSTEANSLSEPAKRFRSELLARMDGLVSTENSNIVLLAATNAPWSIDAALLRRLEKRIYVTLPDEDTRLNIFSLYLSKRLLNSESKMISILQRTMNYSPADIKLICKQAWMMEIAQIWKKLEKDKITIDLVYALTDFQILEQAISLISPTNTSLNKYNEWSKSYKN
ncbi:katanin p60 ATPase-containing subunit A-like 2 [Xylocopa sonorina]|uniref:katanin p60 ATPase-containing subunit A-like 2 n=1 Tax=Xylocopa sonorina TaxID=1818115 RepID=UPI00403AC145